VFLYFKFLERDGNRGLGLLPLYSLDWIGIKTGMTQKSNLTGKLILKVPEAEAIYKFKS